MKKLFLIALFALIALPVFATEEMAAVTPQAPSFKLSDIPGLKQGIAYDFLGKGVNYLSTIDVITWKKLSLEAGYAGDQSESRNKAVFVLSYDIANLKDYGVKVPVLDLIDFRAGAFVGYGRIIQGRGRFAAGLSATVITVKF